MKTKKIAKKLKKLEHEIEKMKLYNKSYNQMITPPPPLTYIEKDDPGNDGKRRPIWWGK